MLKAALEETLSLEAQVQIKVTKGIHPASASLKMTITPSRLRGHSLLWSLWMGAKLIFGASFVYQWRPYSRNLNENVLKCSFTATDMHKKEHCWAVHKWRIKTDNTWRKCWECERVQDEFFGTLYSRGEAQPWTQQLAVHAPCYFLSNTPLISLRLPPPLLSCLTCSSFCPVAEELISEWGVWARNWRRWWCWGPLAGLCCKMAGGGCSDLLHMCSQHLRNVLFSSWGLSVVTSVNKPTRCFLFLSDIFQLLPLQLPLLHSYNNKWNTSWPTVMYHAKNKIKMDAHSLLLFRSIRHL